MLINKTYKTEIKPNNKQKTFLMQSCGVSRLAYNWGLDLIKNDYEQGEKYKGAIGLHKALCAIKKAQFPFMYDVSKQAPQNSLRDLDKAMKNFWRGIKNKKHIGFPKFKSKKYSKNSFRIDGANIDVTDNFVKLPKIEKIRLKERNYIPTENIKVLNCTISKEINRWFISVSVQEEIFNDNIPEEIIGIDLGIKDLATCSNGLIFNNPKYTNKYAKQLKFAQRELSRKIKGSKNRDKQRIKVAKIHKKIRNSRKDTINKMTSNITKTKCRIIGIENLCVSGMTKNHKLAKAVTDASFFEIRRQLEYKSEWNGGRICLVDRFFPSSKTCSCCGLIKEMPLNERVYSCDCGFVMDRDLNASINLETYTASSAEFNAYGENIRLASSELEKSNLCEVRNKLEFEYIAQIL